MKRLSIFLLLCITSGGISRPWYVDSDTEDGPTAAPTNTHDNIRLNGKVTTKHILSNVVRCLQLFKTERPTFFRALAEYAELSRYQPASMSGITFALCKQYSLDISDTMILNTVHACLRRGRDGRYSVVDPLRGI